jgi:hypothetical protein
MRTFQVEFYVPRVGHLSLRIGAQSFDGAIRAVLAQYPAAQIGAVRQVD